jgi:hypothetical protein
MANEEVEVLLTASKRMSPTKSEGRKVWESAPSLTILVYSREILILNPGTSAMPE